MKISDHGLKLLAQWEGDVLHVYKDAAGLPTVGIGHLLTKTELMENSVTINGVKVPLAGGLTEEQALALLAQDVAPITIVVNSRIGCGSDLTQAQFDALVIFAFNIGECGFASSSVLKAVKAGDLDQVPADMMLWDKITDPRTHEHVVCQGLVERRKKEIALWEGAL